ncbi:MAG: hypothetical protein HQL43_06930 [Alphaproteobacteria bacterium]|nr:hypothetical protein [Alphaproteobacteria bacterium]
MKEMTKMTFKVDTRRWKSFDERVNSLPIKRDPFLNNIIKREAPRLAKAMEGKKLSGTANRWISGQLARLRTTTVNIGIEKSVAEDLKLVVAESHMVRDAFFNRLIAFLMPSDKLLDYFDLPHSEDGSVGRAYVNIQKPVSPMATLVDTFDDPLWYLHMAVEEVHETNLYLLDFPSPKMDGYACWLDDARVPKTKANKQAQREMEEFSRALGVFELDAFPSKKVG